MKRSLLAAAAALAVLSAAQAGAQSADALTTSPTPISASEPSSRTISTVYQASWNGFAAANISVAARINPNSYSATANIKPAGLTTLTSHLKKSTTYSAQSQGAISASDDVSPSHYSHHGGKKNRQVDVDFSSKAVNVTATPIFGDMGDPPASAAQRLEAVDSLSAIVSMVNASPDTVCNRKMKVFDGRARFDLTLTPSGSEKIKVPGYKGAAQRCNAVYRRVAGYQKPKKGDKPLVDKPFSIWFAPLNNGLHAPIKISVDSNWGPIEVNLQSVVSSRTAG